MFLCLAITAQSQITSFPYTEDFNTGDGSWTASGTLSGRLVETKSVINTNSIELSIEGAPGVYFVELFDNEMNKAVIRVVKK